MPTETEHRNNCFIALFEAGPSIRLRLVLQWMRAMCGWGWDSLIMGIRENKSLCGWSFALSLPSHCMDHISPISKCPLQGINTWYMIFEMDKHICKIPKTKQKQQYHAPVKIMLDRHFIIALIKHEYKMWEFTKGPSKPQELLHGRRWRCVSLGCSSGWGQCYTQHWEH